MLKIKWSECIYLDNNKLKTSCHLLFTYLQINYIFQIMTTPLIMTVIKVQNRYEFDILKDKIG